MKPSLQKEYFDALYAENPDPWHFATKEYEHQKYSVTLENLPREHYGAALELGCSIGVLTDRLAQRADDLLAVDAAQAALDQAAERCANHSNVHFQRVTLPADYPTGQFELVLMSEVGYYFALPDLGRLAEKVRDSLVVGGDLVLVHYLPTVPDYPLTGDDVHEFFLRYPGLKHLHGLRAERYRLDSFRREV